jgi:hypothetical protein
LREPLAELLRLDRIADADREPEIRETGWNLGAFL